MPVIPPPPKKLGDSDTDDHHGFYAWPTKYHRIPEDGQEDEEEERKTKLAPAPEAYDTMELGRRMWGGGAPGARPFKPSNVCSSCGIRLLVHFIFYFVSGKLFLVYCFNHPFFVISSHFFPDFFFFLKLF